MKIVIAPDKFKGTLSSFEFCEIFKEAILSTLPNTKVLSIPLADGGDGTIEIIHHYLGGSFIKLKVNNPFFQSVEATYLYSSKHKTAFIEMAEASGVKLIPEASLNVIEATTYGTGELIKNAIRKGAKKIILGLGGSATNDCGIGMASALGYRFLDNNGNSIIPIGKNLSKITTIVDTDVIPELYNVDFKIACDVNNPLYGVNGAAKIYAKQKGASDDSIDLLEKGLIGFSKIINTFFNTRCETIIGGGAAGGMGVGCNVFLKGKLISGYKLIQELADFEKKIENADWIVTGEGKLDPQTESGKTIQGILKVRKTKNKVAVICGEITTSKSDLKDLNIDYADEIIRIAKNKEDAFNNTKVHLLNIAKNFITNIH